MSSLRKNLVAKFRQSTTSKKKARGKRAAFRQPWLEALEARVVLSGGVFVQELGPSVQSWPRASFIDPIGNIVAAGNMNGDVATFRFTSNGTLDYSFGGDGSVTTDLSRGGSYDWAMDAVPYTYGNVNKILVAGRAHYLTPALLRDNANGSLDNSFGTKGIVKADSGYFKDVLVQEDNGKILALGSGGLYRYTGSGAVDRSFGGDGIVEVPGRTCMALQTVEGVQYVVTGGLVAGVYTDDFILARYRLSDGSLDTSFGVNGTIVTDFGFSDYLRDLEITSSNEIIAVGLRLGRKLWLSRHWPLRQLRTRDQQDGHARRHQDDPDHHGGRFCRRTHFLRAVCQRQCGNLLHTRWRHRIVEDRWHRQRNFPTDSGRSNVLQPCESDH